MPAGDFSLVTHGIFDLSGAGIATAVGNINIDALQIASGAGVHIVSTGQGSAAVLEVNVL